MFIYILIYYWKRKDFFQITDYVRNTNTHVISLRMAWLLKKRYN